MGSIPSALKSSSRNLRQIIRTPRLSKEQPRTSAPQALSQSGEERAKEGRTQDPAIGSATYPVELDSGVGTASINQKLTAFTSYVLGKSPAHHPRGIITESFHSTPTPRTAISPSQSTATPATHAAQQSKMATDEEYIAFLEKANADPNEGFTKTQNKSKAGGSVNLKAVDKGEEVPVSLKEAIRDKLYVSDADEPFEVVCLRLPGGGGKQERKGEGMPDEGWFYLLYLPPLSLPVLVFFA